MHRDTASKCATPPSVYGAHDRLGRVPMDGEDVDGGVMMMGKANNNIKIIPQCSRVRAERRSNGQIDDDHDDGWNGRRMK